MYLLDTTVVSELRKAERADPGVTRWASGVPSPLMYVSVITIEEIETGILRVARRDLKAAGVLRSWLETRVIPGFGERILPVDLAVARRSAALHVPDPRPENDALIAATALVHGMKVVTRNVSDFHGIGAPAINPWS